MIETIKNLATILFFVVASIVTVLSYIQARKTLFAPIHTETFKLQLKAFEETLVFFQNKSESDFLDYFDLHRIVSLNSLQMADKYVSMFFENEMIIDREARVKIFEPLIGGVASMKFAKKYFEKMDANAPIVKPPSEVKKTKNPAIIFTNWQKYEHGMVGYTKVYKDQENKLARLTASPLLPKPLRDHIGEFQHIAQSNLTHIGETITKCAKLMTEHFPTATDMKKFSSDWVWNEYNEERKHFEPVAQKVLDYINNYLKIENLMQ